MKQFLITESEKKRIIEMHKSRSSKHYLNESDDELLQCVATAFDLSLTDIIKLAPCASCKEDPSQENIMKCVNAIKNLDSVKNKGAMELLKMGMDAASCLGGKTGIGPIEF